MTSGASASASCGIGKYVWLLPLLLPPLLPPLLPLLPPRRCTAVVLL